jgi:predicted PhzF superfamily epimerase YddE/YHI9
MLLTAMTCAGAGEADLYSRFFGPWCGNPEDAVTGSAHCLLAPHFCRLRGCRMLRACQGPHREGALVVEWETGAERVMLHGDAKVIIRGTIELPKERVR